MAAMSPLDLNRQNTNQQPLEFLDREIELAKAVKEAAINSFKEVYKSYREAPHRKVSEIGTKSENSLPNAVNDLFQKLLSKGQEIELASNRLSALEEMKSRALLLDSYISFVLERKNIVISKEVMSFVISQFGDELKTLLAKIELSKFLNASEDEISALYIKLDTLIETIIYNASKEELQVLISKSEFAEAFSDINEKLEKWRVDLVNEREGLNQERAPVRFFPSLLGFRSTQVSEIADWLPSDPQGLDDQTITTLQRLLNVIVKFEQTHN